VADDAVIRIMYTSGTESRPKGAMLSSRALVAEYVSCVIEGGMTSDDIDLHTLPLYHCAQLDCFLGPDLMVGATSIILPGPDPAAVRREPGAAERPDREAAGRREPELRPGPRSGQSPSGPRGRWPTEWSRACL